MSEAFGLEVVKIETLSPPDSNTINELMKQPPHPQKQHDVEPANMEQLFSDSSMNEDNMQINYHFSTRKRGLSWSDMETRALLEVWTERNNLFEVDDLCNANGQIYRSIASEMAGRGYQKSAIQCKTRMKTLKRAYKHCRMLIRTRGKVKRLCRFYKEIDYIVRNTYNKKKPGPKTGANLESDGKQPANTSWESAKNTATDGGKFDPLSLPLMECEVIENDLSDEIEISDDDDDEDDAANEEEENMTLETKTGQSVPSTSLCLENKPVETKLEPISVSPDQSKWLNVISLEDSTNSSNTNHVSNNQNILIEMGGIAKPNSQNQVTNARTAFPFTEPSNIFLPEKELPIPHLNVVNTKSFSSKPVLNQVEMNSGQKLEALSEPIAKELWTSNIQGVRNILQKQGIGQFCQQNENRVNANTFQTTKHFHQPLDIIQVSQPVLDKSFDSHQMTSSAASSSYTETPVGAPVEILVPGNEARSEMDDPQRQQQRTADMNHFEQTLKSIVTSFTNTLEQIQQKHLQTETLRLDLERKKLEVERERQVLERDKMKTDIQRHREDREHQFAMLKMILQHVSSPRSSVSGETVSLDSNTSHILNSVQTKPSN